MGRLTSTMFSCHMDTCFIESGCMTGSREFKHLFIDPAKDLPKNNISPSVCLVKYSSFQKTEISSEDIQSQNYRIWYCIYRGIRR